MTSENISKTVAQTRGQNQSQLWHACRKGIITASKAHEVFTKMRKVIFDKELWGDMTDKFTLYYKNFYLKTFFVK